jgi:xylose isomerase
MDTFARGLIIADNILENSNFRDLREGRYTSFNSGDGKKFENGDITIEELRNLAIKTGEPAVKSGKQELLENLFNQYIR